MPVFSNLNNLRTYMEALKEIDKAKEIGYSLEIRKFHPVATDMQKSIPRLRYHVSFIQARTDVLSDTFRKSRRMWLLIFS